jgi:uncharacterized LabA/DUF88 family protein
VITDTDSDGFYDEEQMNLLGLNLEDKTVVYIDGPNLYSSARSLSLDIDYKKLLDLFRRGSRLIRAFYYTAMLDKDDGYIPIQKLVDYLNYNGYAMVTKPAKEFTDANGRKRTKGNMDIDIAVDMLEMAPHVDHVVLFSGDGDFRRLVEAVQRHGVRVTVVSTIKSHPSMAADELRRQADIFVELDDMKPAITRVFRERMKPDDEDEESGDE